MSSELSLYRRLYTKLLQLYPKPYRDRFGEGMKQTFNDLGRERAAAGHGLSAFALSTFSETFFGIVREHISSSLFSMQKSIFRLFIGTLLLLLIPLALTVRDGNVPNVGWNWSAGDFVIAFILIFGVGLAFIMNAQKSKNIVYKVAVGLSLATAFVFMWINAAVGIIGDGDFPNALYLIVLAIGFFGGIISRFEPRGMMWTMFAAAAGQALVPVIALFIWNPATSDWSPGVAQVFLLNAVFAVLFLGSAVLFWQAAEKRSTKAA